MIFWVEKGVKITYATFISELKKGFSVSKLAGYDYFFSLLIHILDGINIDSYEDLIFNLKNKSADLNFQIYTTGTTSAPKKVQVSVANAIRHIKEFDNKSSRVWGMCYPEGTFASTQVFFQALFNKDQVVFCYENDFKYVNDCLINYKVSNLTCTPTFLRMILMHCKTKNNFVRKVTTGGEKMTKSLLNDLKKWFVMSEYLNVYATSETGSLLSSDSDLFKIPSRYIDLIKIRNGRIHVHTKLLNKKETLKITEDWYDTGDQVEFVDGDLFKIKSRASGYLNSGGHRISPYEVEEKIMGIDGVDDVHVFGKKNSILGTIICAEIISTKLDVKSIKLKLRDQLEKHKVPQKIYFVESFSDVVRGKKKR